MRSDGNISTRIVSGVASLAETEWTRCYPEEAEGWRYYVACEHSPPSGVALSAVEARDEDGLLAAAPLFRLAYRLDTPLQGRLRGLSDRLAALAPSLLEWRLLGVGSPFADRCHIAMRPGLAREKRLQAMQSLAAAIEVEGKRSNAAIIAYKDIAAAEYDTFAESLTARGFAEIGSLPVAVLDLPGATVDDYLGALSAATRKDIRRKLRGAQRVRVERCYDIGDTASAIDRLYQATREASALCYGDFEELPANYFAEVSRALGDKALFMLYWIDGDLIGFNLLLLEQDRAIDKFFGMIQPRGRENNLYVLSWMENVRFCLETGRRTLQSGQTAYGAKVRLGSRLQPSFNLVRHRNAVLNGAIGLAAPLAAFQRWDPDLRRLKAEGRI